MARQKELEGIEGPKIPELNDAMEAHFKACPAVGSVKAGVKQVGAALARIDRALAGAARGEKKR